MIDLTCFLAQQELAIRGHDESDSSVNSGNYVELISTLIMTQRGIVKTHLATSIGLSGDIQND